MTSYSTGLASLGPFLFSSLSFYFSAFLTFPSGTAYCWRCGIFGGHLATIIQRRLATIPCPGRLMIRCTTSAEIMWRP